MSLHEAIRSGLHNELLLRGRRMVFLINLLNEEQLNWRPNNASNSVANLVLHFEGNLGQRYGHSLGGQPDVRNRDAEFRLDVHLGVEEAIARVSAAFDGAAAVLADLPADRYTDQAQLPFGTVPMVDFILQTLVHYGEHVGQAFLLAKIQGVGVSGAPVK